tara:strand:+ start:9550 stop:10266 length:717 start_codon:yes stop_codon:yes gene_type:complete
MNLRDLSPSSSSEDWDKKWADIFDQYQNDRRHAYYVHAMLKPVERRIFELGAGSFRDMAELRRRGVDCEGMDFSSQAVSRAKIYFPEFASAIHQMSAFCIPVADKAFDLTYHNGFWVLFSDPQVRDLAEEQARVSKHRMIATVHNAHNKKFVDYFEKKKVDDPLYNVRFYEKDEISELMLAVCSEVTIVPVGKGKEFHEDLLIKNGITEPETLRAYLSSSGLEFLESSERLMCIGKVR